MKIAVIGAGFSGLSVAWHLLSRQNCEVIVYDPRGIGGGASGIATGLVHPYAGEQVRRSLLAEEGMAATKKLIAEAQKNLDAAIILQEGIIRYIQTEEQRQMFLSHEQYGDVTPLADGSFWIESGMTIDCSLYLEGLSRSIMEKGGTFVQMEVPSIESLEGFDHIVIAAGAGIKKFPELDGLATAVLKGQVLTCHVPDQIDLPERSAIGKGYIALSAQRNVCFVGSTYERDDLTESPNSERAKELLFEKIGQFFPDVHQLEISHCQAALRVLRRGHYFPFVGRVKDNLWVLTAMGSRGLLYHAYLGEQLANAINNSVNVDTKFAYF
jgi:glycine/D-amino acid oxidase-like deaminating enzyme